jgi:hypothetical protein
MRRLAEDETILAVMPRMAQVWARKPEAGQEFDLAMQAFIEMSS